MHNSFCGERHQVWGRRQSRPLKKNQRQSLENLWPDLSIKLPEQGMLDPLTLFPAPCNEIWLEIGFGGGEHLAAKAVLNPQNGFMGCEPFINGVASLVVHIDEKSLKNVKILNDDARLLLTRLPEQSISRIYILFPDPWPKKRHHKRRIIQPELVKLLAHILKPCGYLYLATDHEEYGKWMQDIMQGSLMFENVIEGRENNHVPPPNWHQTRYELKALVQEKRPIYLCYKKK